jgi:IS1 family transposase
VSGVWEEIHSASRYDTIPTEDPFGKGSTNAGTDGGRGGCLNVGEGDGERGRDAADLANAGGDARRETAWGFLPGTHLLFQLDELWANMRHKAHDVWLWVAMEATTKVIPVMELGPRTLDMAMDVVHELCQRMPSGGKPIFTSDGLKLYFYALTAHFGHWALEEGMNKPMWEIAAGFLYAQVKKIHHRRKLVKVEHLMLCGEREKLTTSLKALGLSGKINTAYVERLNLAIRQGVAFLVRWTWGVAQFTSELELHLQWWRGYYHFARYHEALRVQFSQAIQRKVKQTSRRYRSRTPAMAARFTSHRWTVLELIRYPLP